MAAWWGEVMVKGRFNFAVVEAGQAVVYDRYCSDVRYPAEKRVRQAGRGVWAEPGLQQQPWEWR